MGKLTPLQEAAANLALSDYFGIPIAEVKGLKRAMAETRRRTLEEIAERLDVRADEQDVLALREGLEDWEIFQNRHCERVLRREAKVIRALSQKGDEADG